MWEFLTLKNECGAAQVTLWLSFWSDTPRRHNLSYFFRCGTYYLHWSKNFTIIYLIYRISIFNSVFTIVFCRYPADQVPPRTSFRSRQKGGQANHTLPRVHNLSMNRIAQGSSGATTCPAAPAPAAELGAAPGPLRVLWLQLPLPSPGAAPGPPRVLKGPTVYVLLK
jgi:hypothetical protein